MENQHLTAPHPGEPLPRATLSVREAAALLGVSLAAAYRAVHRGELPSMRLGGRLLVIREPLRRRLAGEDA